MNAGEAKQRVKKKLQAIYDEGEATAISNGLLQHVLRWSASELMIRNEVIITAEQENDLQHKLNRLMGHEPLQYVLGNSEFYGLQLYVDPSVLIPRPETEELVDWIVKDVKSAGLDVFENKPLQADRTKTLKILDVGTGSGCIALALKKTMPLAEVWACDVSEEALNVARRNGSMLDIRVDFQGVNFLNVAAQKGLPTVDIVVSNPPYVPLADKATMHPNVVEHEPHTALFVPDEDPLVFYKALAAYGRHRLYCGGRIYMEIHEQLGSAVLRLFEDEGYSVELKKDMQGKDRMVKASPNPSEGGASHRT